MAREGFYRAYKSKQQARDVAKELRTPRGSSKHRLGYPVSVIVQYDKKGKRWSVYIYKRRR